ncbi:MAG: hypothetical protein U5R46_03690 [Gammaproteobacteria bacterium]|nr:hypothetical protein [Gammaproteobacteria bacterium]
MKLNSSKIRLRNAALILGVLAVAPLAAQAMITDHEVDILRLEPDSALNADQRSSGDSDSALARRFGANSGVWTNGNSVKSLNASGEAAADSAHNADWRDAEHFNRLR